MFCSTDQCSKEILLVTDDFTFTKRVIVTFKEASQSMAWIFIDSLRGRLHGAFLTPGLNSGLLTGLGIVSITWRNSGSG